MRRHFHHHGAHAVVKERAQHPLQLHGAGCGQPTAAGDRCTDAPAQDAERPDGRRRPVGGIEKVTHEPNGGGLAVGARDPDQREVPCRPVMKRGRRHGCGTASITDHNGWQCDVRRQGRPIRRLLHQRHHRAAGLRRRQPDMPILHGTLHRDERGARGDAPTVVNEVGDGGRQILRGRYQQPGITQCVQHHGERHVASRARHLSTSIRGISNCTVLPARSMVPAAGRVRTSPPGTTLT